jgi:asparagine synthase (glutamine-hydrolysing)
LRHRGPDDAGVWVDAPAGLALAHRRLAIVDLSAAGHQPMASASGRWVIAFNGEIYNHMALRAELAAAGAAPAWRGHSDTETLLAGFEHWGVTGTLGRCVGMFALALWDKHTRTLALARDRLGEKPLYCGWVGGRLAFGSELKALRALPGFANPVSRPALALMLRLGYVPAPLSIHEGIYKLPPGTWLSVKPGQTGLPAPQRYWQLADAVAAGRAQPVADDATAVRLLEEHLQEAVRLQSLADVPLGAFLSGGVDSSTIVALMQAQSSRPVQTYTVGFEEAGFDESAHAAAVAAHLGTQHTALRVTAAQTRDVIPLLPAMYDEPFADSSQIPTHLVCRAARQQVTVALSGDAGDELFGGYNRYFWGPRVWDKLAWMPAPLRRGLGHAVQAVPPAAWEVLGGPAGVSRLGDKAHKLAASLGSVRDLDDLYWGLVTEWPAGEDLVLGVGGAGGGRADGAGGAGGAGPLTSEGGCESAGGASGVAAPWADDPAWRLGPLPDGWAQPPEALSDARERMMYRDALTYLPDDILCKVDRAAMACSLETRVPFLDHRVVELAWRLPVHMKVRGGVGKWALRQVLYKYVPRELIERPKAGFGIPVGQWLRGPLRDWAEDLLSEPRLRAEGYLHPAPIRRAWAQHLSGRHDWTVRLWGVLMFQAWLAGQRG